MKIAILNVKYSPNLGDGVIAECLESQLLKRIPSAQLFSLDIGGLDNYGSGGSILGTRLSLTKRINFLPEGVQKSIKTALMPTLVKMKYASKWQDQLKACDVVIIGGGHLWMDIDLYFPFRIMTAVNAAPKGIPIFVHAVGVSNCWSARGIKCFNDVFKHGRLIQASVRDYYSRENWVKYFKQVSPHVNPDPAILAAECYGPMEQKPSRTRKLIAFCITDPRTMRMHLEKNTGVVCGEMKSYLAIIQRLYDANFDVMLFTNGGDDDYLRKLSDALTSTSPKIAKKVTIASHISSPKELIKQIASADVLLGHRLHANILAYAYGIPSIGLGWDRKLRSFFEVTNRMEYLVTSNENAPDEIIDKVQSILSISPDNPTRDALFTEAKNGADQLAHAIQKAMRR